MNRPFFLCVAALLSAVAGFGQATGRAIPQQDHAWVGPHGTVRLTRVVPVPKDLSPAAQKYLSQPYPDQPPDLSASADRATARQASAFEARQGARLMKRMHVSMERKTVGGVPVLVFTPANMPAANRHRLLINVHGGGFIADWGSETETIPIAAFSQTRVVAVLYRLLPDAVFPAAVNDTVAVYRALLKRYRPDELALYGTSAGAILTMEASARLRQLGVPLPAALGFFSGSADLLANTDSSRIYGLNGLSGYANANLKAESGRAYAAGANPHDPVLSPLYSDLRHYPPTLFLTSTRDFLLSDTVLLHRRFLEDGDQGQLIVFDALPHAFWNNFQLPEAREADHLIARYFNDVLTKAASNRSAPR